jgi:hypothetical protein
VVRIKNPRKRFPGLIRLPSFLLFSLFLVVIVRNWNRVQYRHPIFGTGEPAF